MSEYLFKDIVMGDEGLLKGPFGSDLKRSLYVPEGSNTYKVYLQENVLQQNNDVGQHYISEEYYHAKMSRYAVKDGDFIVTCDGTLGEIFQLKGLNKPGIISSSLLRITLNNAIVEDDYFYYLWKVILKQKLIMQGNNSVLKHLPGLDDIRNLRIELPSLDVQRCIGRTLRLLDDKIYNNNAICADLEGMAKLLYDYWFVQFDFPDENGKPYKSSGGKMVWNEDLKREIPEGWEVQTLADCTSMYQPKTFDAKLLEQDGKYRVYGAGGYMGRYHEYNHEESEIFISCRGSCGNIYKSMPKSFITGNAMVVHPGNIKLREYLYWSLIRYGVRNCITGSVQPQITRDELSKWKLIIPSDNVIENFNQFATKFDKMIDSVVDENQQLASLRDFLLPMLMNGQVKVEGKGV